MPDTTAVSVNFTLTTSPSNTTPPFEISSCNGTVYAGGAGNSFSGWNAMSVGTPQSSGATFSLSVTDLGYNANSNQTSIGNWAVVFIPRPGTTQPSPFGNQAGSALITGSGGSMSDPGVFALTIPNSVKIQQLGNNVTSAGWDWVLMVQMVLPNGGNTLTQCFSSDPEMDVT